ncbi:MAG TPA: YgaP-like transmembrane domain [Nocardioides sp.]|nr:YgaP-like transmembrane domain [Nocardioides sp.]
MNSFNVDRAVFLLAGAMTLVGLLLAVTVSEWFLLVPAFVGLNMIQASITGACPAAFVFQRLGLRTGCAFR